MLQQTVPKLYRQMIFHRATRMSLPELCCQGFEKKRQVAEFVHCLKIFVETTREFKLDHVVFCTDVHTCFDEIPHMYLNDALVDQRFPKYLASAVL